MNIGEFLNSNGWNENYKNIISRNFDTFNDLQTDFINWGGLEKPRVLVCAPTASGKTLLGILGILKKIHEGKNSFIYLVPYNSIRDEKYNDLLQKFEDFDLIIKKGYSGLKKLHNGEANLVVSDFSAFDRFSRNFPEFVLASLYIFDEIDVLGTDYFGPSIEGSIARLLRKGSPNLIAISATIPEFSRLKEWFNAEYFSSDYKPVIHQEEVIVVDTKQHQVKICELFLTQEGTRAGQILIMIYNKPRVMSYARNLAEMFSQKGIRPLDDNDSMILEIIENAQKTKTIRTLIGCLKYRIAFHHRDLPSNIRNRITEFYNNGGIKIITCSPTLLRGVNLKTRTVILPDPTIYIYKLQKSIQMPFIDYLQFKGRAGRPPFEDRAFLFIFAKNETAKRDFEAKYLNGTMETLKSGFVDQKNRLNAPLLDKQILIELYNKQENLDGIVAVFSKYYFAVGIRSLEPLKNKLFRRISNLERKKLIEKTLSGEYTTSIFGDEYLHKFEFKDISIENYGKLLNLSSKILMDNFSLDERFHFRILNELIAIVVSKNYLKISKRGENKVEIENTMREILRNKCGIYAEIINPHYITLICLIEHISHTTLEKLEERFAVDSTRLESTIKIQLVKYLDALIEVLDFLFNNFDEIYDEDIKIGDNPDDITYKDIKQFLEYLKKRVQYGVGFELYPIVTLPNIGNRRGISLFNAINRKFNEKDKLDWKILEGRQIELKKASIEGWGTLIDRMYEKLEGVLSVENKMKQVLSKFNIDYNLKK